MTPTEPNKAQPNHGLVVIQVDNKNEPGPDVPGFDLAGWGALLGGIAAVLAAWGTFRGLTRRKNTGND